MYYRIDSTTRPRIQHTNAQCDSDYDDYAGGDRKDPRPPAPEPMCVLPDDQCGCVTSVTLPNPITKSGDHAVGRRSWMQQQQQWQQWYQRRTTWTSSSSEDMDRDVEHARSQQQQQHQHHKTSYIAVPKFSNMHQNKSSSSDNMDVHGCEVDCIEVTCWHEENEGRYLYY